MSSEITVGMSAPPIGMISSTPNTSDSPTMTGKSCHCVGSQIRPTPANTAIASSARFTAFWPRYVMGRVGITSWSLPAAIRLPVKVRKPRITSTTMAPVRNAVSSPSSSQMAYFAVPTRPAARPPKACEIAVRCGTAVSGTRESGTPTSVPATTAIAIQVKFTISGCSSVPKTAAAMPATPANTPWRAVFGRFSQRSEKMKRVAATR